MRVSAYQAERESCWGWALVPFVAICRANPYIFLGVMQSAQQYHHFVSVPAPTMPHDIIPSNNTQRREIKLVSIGKMVWRAARYFC